MLEIASIAMRGLDIVVGITVFGGPVYSKRLMDALDTLLFVFVLRD